MIYSCVLICINIENNVKREAYIGCIIGQCTVCLLYTSYAADHLKGVMFFVCCIVLYLASDPYMFSVLLM